MLPIREKRVHPGLDNKIITSWNALMLKAYIDAYNVFDEQHFLDVALTNVNFLIKNSFVKEQLLHLAKSSQKINGFLEDYAFIIEALISLYETTLEEKHLHKATDLMKYTIEHFQDKNSKMFFFTSDEDKALITRKMELSDNVIPASNSSIAKSLFILGHHFESEEWVLMSKKMLNNMLSEIENYGPGYSNWAILLLYFSRPFYELAIVGKSVDEKRKNLNKHYHPNRIFAGSASESSLPLLKNRHTIDETLIYVCKNKTCLQPVKELEEALKHLTRTLSK